MFPYEQYTCYFGCIYNHKWGWPYFMGCIKLTVERLNSVYPTVQWLDSVDNCPIVVECCIQLFNGWTVYIQLSKEWAVCVQLPCAVSNLKMVRQCCFQLSNDCTVGHRTVQWSDRAVFFSSNIHTLHIALSIFFLTVRQYHVQLYNGCTVYCQLFNYWTGLCTTIRWLESVCPSVQWMNNATSIVQLSNRQ